MNALLLAADLGLATLWDRVLSVVSSHALPYSAAHPILAAWILGVLGLPALVLAGTAFGARRRSKRERAARHFRPGPLASPDAAYDVGLSASRAYRLRRAEDVVGVLKRHCARDATIRPLSDGPGHEVTIPRAFPLAKAHALGPDCHFERGLFEGLFGPLHQGRGVDVIERCCSAEGLDRCVFEVRPLGRQERARISRLWAKRPGRGRRSMPS